MQLHITAQMQATTQDEIRVLLIEDNPDDQLLVRRAVASERPRIQLECSEQLGSGMSRLRRDHFDALLIDLSLPDSEPDETFENVKRLVRALPVIVLTGRDDREGGLAAVREGAQDYIVKGRDPLKDVLGRSLRYAVARFRADAALRESERRYRDIAESARDVIFRYCIHDGRPHLDYVNRAFESSLGYSRAELNERPELSLGLVHPDDHELVWKIAHGEVPERYTIRFLTKGGDVKWFECGGTPLNEGEVPSSGAQGVGRDVTAQYLAERELEKTREQLVQAQRMEAVGRLAGGVAHDFNNVLTIISSCGHFALRALPDDDPVRADVTAMLEAGRRAESLTSQLLAFSRRWTITPRTVNLNDAFAKLERMLSRLVGENVRVVTRLATHLWNVRVDVRAFEQVLFNLAVNARDAMPEGGQLTVETANVEVNPRDGRARTPEIPPGDYVSISVSDNGAGMDEETRRNAFEPFFTTKAEGTGLGLSTCYGLARQAGGHIVVHSEPGVGTTFTVYLPRAAADETAERAPTRPPPPSVRGHERVLLVEDDASLRETTARVLKSFGYEVCSAGDGEQAIAIAAQAESLVQLLLTDVVLPGLSGTQLAQRLRGSNPNLKVLYMSGHTDDTTARHGVLTPDTPFVSKPFTPERLGRAVRDVLDRD